MMEAGRALRSGRYVITRVLGEGSQGDTLEAVDKQAGRLVAVKRFQVRGAKSWKDVELAEREARVLEALSHPGLPAHVEHFEEDGALYLVMEKIEGESLAARRRRGAGLDRAEVARFLRDAAGILDYLHGRAPPIIHRDIKPGNVIRRPDGSFALVDFGAVRDRLRPEGGSTVVGTFGYMAPEQFQGRALPGSDVYAVGATALVMLTGEEPENLPHRGLAIDVEAALRGRADPALVEVLAAMLEPDPDRRPGKIGPLLAKLGAERGSPAAAAGAARAEREDRKGREGEKKKKAEEKSARRAERAERRAERAERRAEREEARAEEAEWDADRMREEMDQAGRELESWLRNARLSGMRLGLVTLGLAIARGATQLALEGVVPAVLTLLSVVFGSALRDAAANVRETGEATRGMFDRGLAVLRGSAPPAGAEGKAPGPKPRVRVGGDAEPAGRARVVDAEAEAAREREAEAEAEAQQRAARRR